MSYRSPRARTASLSVVLCYLCALGASHPPPTQGTLSGLADSMSRVLSELEANPLQFLQRMPAGTMNGWFGTLGRMLEASNASNATLRHQTALQTEFNVLQEQYQHGAANLSAAAHRVITEWSVVKQASSSISFAAGGFELAVVNILTHTARLLTDPLISTSAALSWEVDGSIGFLCDATCFKNSNRTQEWISYAPLRRVWDDCQTFAMAPFPSAKQYYAQQLLFGSIPAIAQIYVNATDIGTHFQT